MLSIAIAIYISEVKIMQGNNIIIQNISIAEQKWG